MVGRLHARPCHGGLREVYYPPPMMSPGKPEVEVKLRVADLAVFRRRLARLRAQPAAKAGVHEMNTLFDTPQGGLAKHGQLLRLRVEEPRGKARSRRSAGARAVLTYKGPAVAGSAPAEAQEMPVASAQGRPGDRPRGAPRNRYKVREEIEVEVADPQQLGLILEALGLRGWFRYEKHRTSYRLPAALRWAADLKVELDETPIGVFVELEGSPQAIDRAAKLLGYGPADYLTQTYLQLYLRQCRKEGLTPRDMLFPSKKI